MAGRLRMTRQTQFKPITTWNPTQNIELCEIQKAGMWRLEFDESLGYHNAVSYIHIETHDDELIKEVASNSIAQENLFKLNAMFKSIPWIGSFKFALN
jgi:hypothetical protein